MLHLPQIRSRRASQGVIDTIKSVDRYSLAKDKILRRSSTPLEQESPTKKTVSKLNLELPSQRSICSSRLTADTYRTARSVNTVASISDLTKPITCDLDFRVKEIEKLIVKIMEKPLMRKHLQETKCKLRETKQPAQHKQVKERKIVHYRHSTPVANPCHFKKERHESQSKPKKPRLGLLAAATRIVHRKKELQTQSIEPWETSQEVSLF